MTDDIRYWNETLDEMSTWANNIMGEWNGDESGREEDRALQAEMVAKSVEVLRGEINELEEL